MNNINVFLNDNKENMTNDIIKLVNIPSVYSSEGTKQKPFGTSVNDALVEVLKIAERMGMKTKNVGGYAGEITIGEGSYIIGVLGHIDVVEAGEGWKTEPFNAVVKEEKIYGRGSMDDKGPVVSSLYAMKYLMDNALIPENVALRMIIGTNEEELWHGIDYYVKNTSVLPDCSIVPDGYFPVVFCEKGLLDFDLLFDLKNMDRSKINKVDFSGGVGRNVVPAKANCIIEFADGRVISIAEEGKSTHAMSPEKGINAISKLMEQLSNIEIEPTLCRFINVYNEYIGYDYNGGHFGIGFEDELSGKLAFNVGKIYIEDEKIIMECNIRYPASMEKETSIDAINNTLKLSGFEYKERDFLRPICVEKNSTFFKILMNSYQKITGDTETQPLAIGGATYARAIPNAVAFGPLFPYEEELAHEANEFLSIDSLMKMTEIFANAIFELAKERN